MTTLLAIVRNSEEAAAARAGGADEVVIANDAAALVEAPATIGLMVWSDEGDDVAPTRVESVGSNLVWLPLRPAWYAAIGAALAQGRRVVGCLNALAIGDEGEIAEARTLGLADVLVTTPPFSRRRLLDAIAMPDLAQIARLCRTNGLRCGFAGALELPDVPRLQALAPDLLGFDTILRDDEDRFDAGRLHGIRDVLKAAEAPSGRVGRADEAVDHILVRDWTVTMSIGAYARERGMPQRVRFTVDAGVRPAGQGSGFGEVVSYDLITDAIDRLAASHVDLVENVAERLAEIVLAHPRVVGLDITVEKLDIGPGSVGCRIVRQRTPV